MARLKALGILKWNVGSDVKLHELQSSAMVLIDVFNLGAAYSNDDVIISMTSLLLTIPRNIYNPPCPLPTISLPSVCVWHILGYLLYVRILSVLSIMTSNGGSNGIF